MGRRRHAFVALGIGTLLSTGALIAAPVLAGGSVLATDPSLGQIVARGVRNGDNACSFSGSTPTTQTSGGWLAMSVSSNCIVTVSDAWKGTLADGPAKFASLADDMAADESVAPASQTTQAVATTCKTVKQLFFTFGFGGALFDKLTYLWSSMRYCYNDSFVWGVNSDGSGCAGTNEPTWAWVVDQCVVTSQSFAQSMTKVWYEDRGNYHCNPPAQPPCNLSNPDGYFHRLFAKVTAFDGGSSTCTSHWDGFVVLGPEQQFLSGCQ